MLKHKRERQGFVVNEQQQQIKQMNKKGKKSINVAIRIKIGLCT